MLKNTEWHTTTSRPKKKRILIAIASLAVLILFLVLILPLFYSDNDKDKISAQMDMLLKSELQNQGVETSGQRLDDLIISHVTCNVLQVGESSCRIEISAPDMRSLFESVIDLNKNVSDPAQERKDMESTIEGALEKGDFILRTVIVDVQYKKHGGEIEIVENEDLADAIYGGLLSFVNEMVGEVS